MKKTDKKETRLLRVGIIGPGGFADRFLIPALQSLPDAQLWSVLARDKAKAKACAEKFKAAGKAPASDSLDSFLADDQLDAVIIATPDKLHAPQAIAAARAGKHVFIEKPMATSETEAVAVVEACKSANVKLAAGYHLRWHAGHRLLRQRLQDGAIGAVSHIRVQWTLKMEPVTWRSGKELGQWWSLGATGTHGLDLAQWFAEPNALINKQAVLTNSVYGGPNDESALVSLVFAGGITASVFSSVVCKAPRVVEILGADGSCRLTDTLGPYGTGTISVNSENLEFTPCNPYAAELADFLDAIKSNREPEVNGEVGLRNVRLLDSLLTTLQPSTP